MAGFYTIFLAATRFADASAIKNRAQSVRLWFHAVGF